MWLPMNLRMKIEEPAPEEHNDVDYAAEHFGDAGEDDGLLGVSLEDALAEIVEAEASV